MTYLNSKVNRNKSIQILRGVSVLAVVLFHAFPSIFKSGYLGVDLFFVISGFVITPVINKIIGSQNKIMELKKFYIKRYWRLIPALTIALIGTLILGLFFSGIGYLKNLFNMSLSTQLIVANYFNYKSVGDYFRPQPQPLIHTWSLSVEEQIYLLLPVALMLFINITKKSLKIPYFYLLFGMLSFVFYLYSWPRGDVFSFYSFHTRFWEFSIGALIYFASLKNHSNNKSLKRFTGVVFVPLLVLIFFGPNNFIYLVVFIILVYKYLFFKLDKILPNSIVKLMVNLGDKSYSLYLVHMPILWIFNEISILLNLNPIQQYGCILFGIGVTYLIGNLLYLRIENRYRYRNYRVKSKKVAHIKLQVLLLVITSAGIATGTNNYFLANSVLNRPLNEMDPLVGDKCNVMLSDVACKNVSSVGNKKYLLIGDSHAGSISRTISEIFSNRGDLDIYLKTGCQLIYNEVISSISFKQSINCQAYYNKIAEYVKFNRYEAILVSFISVDGESFKKKTEYDTLLEYKLSSIKILQKLCNCKVVVLGPTPLFPVDNNFFSPNRKLIQGNENPSKKVKIIDMNDFAFKEDIFLTKNLLNNQNIKMINLMDEFCDLNYCIRWSNGWLFADYSHLSNLGAKYLKFKLVNELDKAKI
jgi:peptidoglycan/LPS O-acetylase OafA/YrhL